MLTANEMPMKITTPSIHKAEVGYSHGYKSRGSNTICTADGDGEGVNRRCTLYTPRVHKLSGELGSKEL